MEKQKSKVIMEKLTEKINTFKVSKTIKDQIIKISELEEINIQQACRKLLRIGITKYNTNTDNVDKIS